MARKPQRLRPGASGMPPTATRSGRAPHPQDRQEGRSLHRSVPYRPSRPALPFRTDGQLPVRPPRPTRRGNAAYGSPAPPAVPSPPVVSFRSSAWACLGATRLHTSRSLSSPLSPMWYQPPLHPGLEAKGAPIHRGVRVALNVLDAHVALRVVLVAPTPREHRFPILRLSPPGEVGRVQNFNVGPPAAALVHDRVRVDQLLRHHSPRAPQLVGRELGPGVPTSPTATRRPTRHRTVCLAGDAVRLGVHRGGYPQYNAVVTIYQATLNGSFVSVVVTGIVPGTTERYPSGRRSSQSCRWRSRKPPCACRPPSSHGWPGSHRRRDSWCLPVPSARGPARRPRSRPAQ